MDSDANNSTIFRNLKTLQISDECDDEIMEDKTEKSIVVEDEEEDEPVTLGFLEKPRDPRCLFRHLFPSKAGGVPAWLDPVELPAEKSRTCGFCGDPLQFVLQVYAPLAEKEYAFHRTLYVFMCPSLACLMKDQHEQWKRGVVGVPRSVKVFRSQLPRFNSFYSSNPPKHDGTDKPTGGGVSLCCWCGTWNGEKVCSHCKTARYCSKKHQEMHWRSRHKIECQIVCASQSLDLAPQTKSQSTNKVCIRDSIAASNKLWPEYEIVNEEECLDDDEASEDNGLTTSLVIKERKDDEVYQALLDKFEADEDKKSWATFNEHVSRAPEQVLRYCRYVKASPLWPVSAGKPSKEDIPKCSYCAGPMSFEFQILPQLLYYFGVQNDVNSLDWATIIVYTCSDSCDKSSGYREEFPWVQIYSSP